MRFLWKLSLFIVAVLLMPFPLLSEEQWKHGYADSDGVKIHYVEAGEGPLLIMIHGFPDYWYSWRDQIPTLAKTHHVVAIDLRGFNRSDQPVGVEQYAVSNFYHLPLTSKRANLQVKLN